MMQKHTTPFWLPALFLLFALTCPMLARAQGTETQHVKITMMPERNTIVANDTLWILINEEIEPGWHTYWTNPGDSGAAPRIKWTLPEGFTAGDIEWPAPHKITLEGLVSYGYEGNAAIAQTIAVPDTLPKGPLTLTADVEILVCKDICIPEKSTHTITINDPAAQAVDNETAVDAFVSALPSKADWRGTYAIEGKDFVVRINGGVQADPKEVVLESFVLMPVEWGLVQNAAATRAEIKNNPYELVLRQTRDTRDLTNVGDVPVIITYKRIDGQSVARAVTLHPSQTVPASANDGVKKNTDALTPDGLNFISAILFAFLGGIILNLMPCVFPVLSIKALSLIRLREKGFMASALSGLVYTAGIMLTFGAIGSVLLGLRASGSDIGWGFQLQNPVIVLALAYLLFVIGLNLSGLFDIDGSFTGIGSSLVNKGGLPGTFFTGILATLVATPCTAPFMAGALGYALVQPPAVAMAVFLALGMGLAFPYLLLSIVTALSAFLPRPGLWMVKFREALAFPVYASAAWLVWVLAMQVGSQGLIWTLTGMVALAFGFWLLIHRPERRFWRVIIVVMALIAFLFAIMPILDRSILRPPATADERRASLFTPEKLDALLLEKDPVFVYMTAAWCITCKVNERVAINTEAVQSLFKANGVVVLEGDWTSMNPDITKFLKSYGRSGVPLYVYYGAKDAGGTRPGPVVLPQILTPGLMTETIGASK